MGKYYSNIYSHAITSFAAFSFSVNNAAAATGDKPLCVKQTTSEMYTYTRHVTRATK